MRGAAIIASTFGIDVSGFEADYRYQPTRTTRAIYAIGDGYYAVGKSAPKDEVGNPWELAKDQCWAGQNGTKLWYSAMRGQE
jgi:hypothetical protein